MVDFYESFYRVINFLKEKQAMNSVIKECTEFKQKYDACYSVWFTDQFLRGHTSEDACALLFAAYQQCLKKSMKEHNIQLNEISSEDFELEKKSACNE